MAYSGINVPYYPGDGLRFPINQDHNPKGVWSGPGALLPPARAAAYFRKQRGIPNPYASAIKTRPEYSQVVPSFTAQFGRGRNGVKTRIRGGGKQLRQYKINPSLGLDIKGNKMKLF